MKERQRKERQHKGWKKIGREGEKREGNLKGGNSKKKDGNEGRGMVTKDTRMERGKGIKRKPKRKGLKRTKLAY